MKDIPLTRGLVALVDDEDYELVDAFKWYVHRTGYVIRNVPHPEMTGKRIHLPIHRFIMGLPFGDSREVDHIDGNPLNNQRANLRVCTGKENARNKRTPTKSRAGLKGVYWRESRKKWIAQITVNGVHTYLGSYNTPEEAHAAYCEAAPRYHGEYANFGKAA